MAAFRLFITFQVISAVLTTTLFWLFAFSDVGPKDPKYGGYGPGGYYQTPESLQIFNVQHV